MYTGTKKWGTVRVIIKRKYVENNKYKQSKRKDRLQDKASQNLPNAQFGLVVKAQSPRRKISTIIEPKNVGKF